MSDWYARFERDAAFRRRVTDAYNGRHEVADAVWWLDHPGEDAPSGAVSPRRPLAELQRAAFGRPGAGDAGEAGEVADGGNDERDVSAGHGGENAGAGTLTALREFEAFQAVLERDRAETMAAIEAAIGVPDARVEPAPRRRLVLAGVVVGAVILAGGLAVAATAFLGVGAGGVAGGSAGASGGASAGDSDATSAASADPFSSVGSGPALTASPFPNFPPGIGADSYATIFTHEQSAADLPPAPLPVNLRPASFRALSTGQYTSGAVYAAVNTDDEVCLVVYGNATDFGISCADIAVVAARGLQVSLTTPDRRDPQTGVLIVANGLSARWEPDGNFTLDTSMPYDRD